MLARCASLPCELEHVHRRRVGVSRCRQAPVAFLMFDMLSKRHLRIDHLLIGAMRLTRHRIAVSNIYDILNTKPPNSTWCEHWVHTCMGVA